MIYSVYRATNHFRHEGTHGNYTDQQQETKLFLNQILMEADKGAHKHHLLQTHPQRLNTTPRKAAGPAIPPHETPLRKQPRHNHPLQLDTNIPPPPSHTHHFFHTQSHRHELPAHGGFLPRQQQ